MSRSDTSGSRRLRDQDLRRFTDLLCEKVYWWLQRDKSSKGQQKLQSEKAQGSKFPEFASIKDALGKQIRSLDAEKTKCAERIDDSNHKLMETAMSMLEKLGPANVGGHQESFRGPDVTAECSVSEIDTRLTAFQKSAEESFQAQLTHESNKLREEFLVKHEDGIKTLREELADKYQRQNSVLEERLTKEASKNKVLEDKVAKLKAEVDDICCDHAKTVEVVRQLEAQFNIVSSNDMAALETLHATSTSIKELVDEFSGRLSKALVQFDTDNKELKTHLEDHNSQLILLRNTVEGVAAEVTGQRQTNKETNAKVASLEETIETAKLGDNNEDVGVAINIQNLASEFGDFQRTVKRQENEQNTVKEELSSLKSKVSMLPVDEMKQVIVDLPKIKEKLEKPPSPVRASPPAPMAVTSDFNGNILEIVKCRVADASNSMRLQFQEDFKRIATGFGQTIDKERTARTEMESKIKKIDESCRDNNHDLRILKETDAKALADLDQRLCQQSDKTISQNRDLIFTRNQLEKYRDEAKIELNGLQLQIGCFNDWKKNFSSQVFYTNIVRHIQSSTPDNVNSQIKKLVDRIDHLEAGSDDIDMKKRKGINGQAVVVNGKH